MENVIINEIRRVGTIVFLALMFMMAVLSIITNLSIGKVQGQNQQIIKQNQQIIELLQQDKSEE